MPKLSETERRVLAIAYKNRGRRNGLMDVTPTDLLVAFCGYARLENDMVSRKQHGAEHYQKSIKTAKAIIGRLVKANLLTYGCRQEDAGACLTTAGSREIEKLLAGQDTSGASRP